jgi:uncharacterized protein YndB with AHSA1/START domain
MGFLVRDEISLVTSTSPEVCYQLLIQSQDVNHWWRGVQSRVEGPNPWTAGTRIFYQGRLGRPRWECELKEVIPNKLIEGYYTGGDFRGAESWEFEPVGDGARLVHRWLGIEAATPVGRALRFSLGGKLHSYLFTNALAGLAQQR